MNYKEYQVVDFINDEFFVEWVRNPARESNNFWREWVSANPNQVTTINQARQFITSLEYADHKPLKSEEYAEIFENILRARRESVLIAPKRNYIRTTLKIAASILVVIMAFVLYRQSGSFLTDTPTFDKQETRTITQNNPKGQKSLITLPDGSKVKLAAESKLTYNIPFAINDRKVALIGEAFFDVAAIEQMPFTIRTGKIETLVRGTSFNIRSYEDEDNVQILVVTGMVTVSDGGGNSIVLNPHEMVEYDHYDNQIKKSVCDDLKKIIGWKDGVLVFEDEPFDKVIDKIERWYGVKIEFGDDFIAPGNYTGAYHNKSIKKVMDGLSYASEFKYKIINDHKILVTQ